MSIRIKNKAGLFLMRDGGFNSFCFTKDESQAENFESIESAQKVKAKLMHFGNLIIDAPENIETLSQQDI